MGVPRLKKKIELNYRRGRPGCWCEECAAYVGNFGVRGIGEIAVLRAEPRCRVIGLKNSRRYKISPVHCCDAWALRIGARMDPKEDVYAGDCPTSVRKK